MNRAGLTLSALTFSLALPSAAMAGELVVQAVQLGKEAIRYDKGVPTLDLVQSQGAVQVVPLGKDHGSYVFGIAVFNAGKMSANFDVSNVAAQVGSQPLRIFTVDQLIGKAKSRATWSQIGMAVLGGIGSAASASQRNTYRSSFHSKYGSSYASFSAPSLAGQLRAQRIQDDTVFALGAIQARLDETRQKLGNEIVQLTTVDPGDSYAGRVVLEKIKGSTLPQQITIAVNWNGELYNFAFQLAKAGTPAPVFTPRPVRDLPVRSPGPKEIPAILGGDELQQEPIQQVAYSTGRPARDVAISNDRPMVASAPRQARSRVFYSASVAGYAPTPVILPGGLVEVPYQPASWAATIDPVTGFVVPMDRGMVMVGQ